MDHRAIAMAGVRRRRRRTPRRDAPLQWADVRRRLHMRLKDAAAELNVPVASLRTLCHQNGFPRWPGKKIRYMNSIGENLKLQLAARKRSPLVGLLAGPSRQRAAKLKTAETKKKEEDEVTSVGAPPVGKNHAPAKELTTLNLIDKVGSSSSSEDS